MEDAIKMAASMDPARAQTVITARFDESLMRVGPAVLEEIVRGIAARYVEDNYAAIAAKIDQQAIANLAVAHAGKTMAASIDLNTQAVVADVLNKVRLRY